MSRNLTAEWLARVTSSPDFVERYPLRRPVHSYRKPNRRFPARVGEVPGRIWRLSNASKPNLLVAIDTSGSMSSLELDEIAAQLRVIGTLVRVTIVECDAAIQRVYPFRGLLKDVRGRGGTDFNPVFDPEFLMRHRPQGIVYFTDGGGPHPSDDPGIKTLWVLTKGLPFGCRWGEKVYMEQGPLRVDEPVPLIYIEKKPRVILDYAGLYAGAGDGD